MLFALLQADPVPQWLRIAFWATLALTAIWTLLSLFRGWQVRAANLTLTGSATPNPDARPAFLDVDSEAQAAALSRADGFDAALLEREARAREAAGPLPTSADAPTRIAGIASFCMAVFSLITLIAGSIWQVSWIGTVWENYSAAERLTAVIQNHPVGFAVSVLVILYHLVAFFVQRKWRDDH